MMISTSLICTDFTNDNILNFLIKNADFLHFDIMDKEFSKCEGIDLKIISNLKSKNAKLDVHIMSNFPEKYINYCIKNLCDIICFHVESKTNIYEEIKRIKNAGIKVGLAICPETNLDALYPYLPYLDIINVMTVAPGPAGQEFQIRELNKIYQLDVLRKKHGYQYLLEIDGSCNEKNYHSIKNVNPDIYVVGLSGLFSLDSNIEHAWKKMNQYMNCCETIFLHADFVGNPLKEHIKTYLEDNNYIVVDLYTDGIEEYPECAIMLCEKVKKNELNLGILCCGTGIGMSIAANKIDKIRAAVVSDPYSAKMAKQHNNANVLCLGSRVLTKQIAEEIVMAFLENKFIYGKHYPRVNRIDLLHTSQK